MANSLDFGGLDTKKFPKMCSYNFYITRYSFKLIVFTVFVQFRSDRHWEQILLLDVVTKTLHHRYSIRF